MKIAIIGSGYVGLVAGTCFAETGNDVICMDIDKKRITSLGQGKVPLYEPEIAELTRYDLDIVSNPEFLKEGAAVDDFLKPDRVVIGTGKASVAEIMKDLYAPFTRTGAPILVMDPCSAEMTKYAANAMLGSRISLMNEIANLCERVGAEDSGL